MELRTGPVARLLARLVVGALLVVACGADDGAVPVPATAPAAAARTSAPVPEPAPSTPGPGAATADEAAHPGGAPSAAATTTDPTDGPPAPAESRPPPRPDHPDLVPALLTIEDLSEGWEDFEQDESQRPEEDEAGGPRICNRDTFDPEQEPDDVADAGFRRSPLGPYLGHVVMRMDGAAMAAAIESLRAAAESCERWTQEEDPGRGTEWTIRRLPTPPLGEQSAAYSLVGEGGVFTVHLDMVLWRRGDLGAAIFHAATSEPDHAETNAAAVRADAKLASLRAPR